MHEQNDFLRKVAKESLRNAEQFVKDAEVLLKKRSYGHAFALAVLGEEELAKAVMYQNAAEGIFGIEGEWKKDLQKHMGKQRIAFGVTYIYELTLIAEDAAYFAKKKTKGDIKKFGQAFEKKLVEIMQDEQRMFASRRGDLYEHLEPFVDLQKEREKATYVDANLEERKIISPKGFTKSKAKRYISHVKERLEVLRHEIGRKMDTADREVTMSLIKAMLNQFSGKQKKKLLDWYGISEKDLGV